MVDDKFIDATVLNQAREDLEIKRVRVSETLIHETETYLFQEFGDRYTRLIAAFNQSHNTKISTDAQDILRMNSSELVLYLLLARNRDRKAVETTYRTQFKNASQSTVAKFMALYDATQETEEALISNQLMHMADQLKGIKTSVSQTREDAMSINNSLASSSEGMGWLIASQMGLVKSFQPDRFIETLNDDEVRKVSQMLIEKGKELAEQNRRTRARSLRGGH